MLLASMEVSNLIQISPLKISLDIQFLIKIYVKVLSISEEIVSSEGCLVNEKS